MSVPAGVGTSVGVAEPPGMVGEGAMVGVGSMVGEVVTFGVKTGEAVTLAVGVALGVGEGSGLAVQAVNIAAARSAASTDAIVFLISSFIPFADYDAAIIAPCESFMRPVRTRKTFQVKFEKKLYKMRIHVILIRRRFRRRVIWGRSSVGRAYGSHP